MAMKVAHERFGSAGFASIKDLERAGLLSNSGGMLFGFTNEKHPRPIRFDADTPNLAMGASGTQKLTSFFGYNVLNEGKAIHLDTKPEIGPISALCPFKERIYFNPLGQCRDAPWFIPANHKINPFEVADPKRSDFFEVVQILAKNLIDKPTGSGGNARHFWGKAVQVSAAVIMDGRTHSKDFSPPDFYNVMCDLAAGGGEYFALHINRMKLSPYSAVRNVALELESKAEMVPGEFGSIMSTVTNSIQSLGSPAMQMSLSGPSTMSILDFITSSRSCELIIMVPDYLLEQCACIVRCIVGAFTIEQQRSGKTRLNINIDEAGQIRGGFEAIPRTYSFGRGIKCRMTTSYQNKRQGDTSLGPEDFDTVVSNSQTKLFLGVGSENSAKFVSDMLGKATYSYTSPQRQIETAYKTMEAMRKVLGGQYDVIAGMVEVAKQGEVGNAPDAVARNLMTPDEVMRLPPDIGLLYIHGLNLKPYPYLKWPYFLNPSVAHRFLPNPYHPPYDRIFIPSRLWGRQKAIPIVSEKVPSAIAHLPQYASGYWSYPKGFCPLKPTFLSRFKR